VDTPLLQLDLGDWRYQFDAAAARGAFFESNWNIPEKVRLQRLLEQRNTNAVGPLSSLPRIALLETGAILTLTGSSKNLTFPVFVNGVKVQTGTTLPNGTRKALSGSWVVRLSTGNGLSGGSLRLGVNIVKLTNAKDDVIDSAYVNRIGDYATFRLASVEEQLVNQFLASMNNYSTNTYSSNVARNYVLTGLTGAFGESSVADWTNQPCSCLVRIRLFRGGGERHQN
jgi:hypothetical protein